MKTYRIALIGCGQMGGAHLDDIYYRENIRITYVCDLNAEKASAFKRKYHAENILSDYRECISREDVDIVIAATYPSTHLSILKECIKHGKHLLCEKPITAGLEEGKEFVRRVKDNPQIKVLVGHILRHNTTYNKVREMIQAGAIGFPIVMRMAQNHHTMNWQKVACAALVGADGVQIRATDGEFAPQAMTRDQKSELLNVLSANGLEISALCGDLGRGFGNKELNPALIEQSKRIIDLAKELGTNIVTTHIGVVPLDRNHERYKIMQDACFELSRYADNCQAHFAVETGPETSLTLKGFLDELGSTGVAVNLDPANLVMVTGDDPVKAVEHLEKYIVHTHAKDGRKLLDRDPEIIYGVSESELLRDTAFIELPLGEGDVPFKEYLDALTGIGYSGYLTIEREVGSTPKHDIILAADYLKQLIYS